MNNSLLICDGFLIAWYARKLLQYTAAFWPVIVRAAVRGSAMLQSSMGSLLKLNLYVEAGMARIVVTTIILL